MHQHRYHHRRAANYRAVLPMHPRQGGAVIIVALALMSTLLFLGLFFFGFATEEAMVARNIAEAAADKAPIEDGFGLDTDAVLGFGYQQVIVSTPADRKNSALYAEADTDGDGTLDTPVSPWSILASRLGTMNADGSPRDVHPFSGQGIAVTTDVNGDGIIDGADIDPTTGIDVDGDGTNDYPQILIDVDGDGTADFDQDEPAGATDTLNPFIVHYGRAAYMPADVPAVEFNLDTGYTYPDINSLFLATDYWDLGDLTDPDDDVHVVKPSFFLPGYHPDRRRYADIIANAQFPGDESGFFNFYTDILPESVDGNSVTTTQSMRPHRNHFNAAAPLGSPVPVSRFIRPGIGASVSGGTASALSGDTTRRLRPFPKLDVFTASGPNFGLPRDPVKGFGVWDGSNIYDYDLDLDKDGTTDANLVDIDHPLLRLPGGREYVPIFGFKILDLDGLLNANAHGNMAEFQQKSNVADANLHDDIYTDFAGTGPRNEWIHHSHLGFSAAEVNLSVALFVNPAAPPGVFFSSLAHFNQSTRQLVGLLADRSAALPVDRTTDGTAPDGLTIDAIANLEFASLLLGRPEFDSTQLRFVTSTSGQILLWPGRYGLDTPFISLATAVADMTAERFPVPGLAFLDEHDNTVTPPDGNPDGVPDDFDSSGGITAGDMVDDNANDNSDVNNAFTTRKLNPSAPPTYIADYSNPSDNYGGGRGHGDFRLNLDIPAGVHPIDVSGLSDTDGYPTYDRGSVREGKRELNNGGLTNNSMRWVYYPGDTGATPFGIQNQGSTGVAAPTTWRDAIALNQLQPSGAIDHLLNDPAEVNLLRNAGPQFDDPFDVKEIAALQLSTADWKDSAFQSRLRNLMPVNFEHNLLAGYIRSQFTTHSWDRTEFAFGPVGLDGGAREWEFDDDDRFPPLLGTTVGSRHEDTDPNDTTTYFGTGVAGDTIVPDDPFRPEFRRLLTIDPNGTNARRLLAQHKLHLNRILSDDILARDGAGSGTPRTRIGQTVGTFTITDWRQTDRAFDDKGNPIFRHLTPHFDFTQATDADSYDPTGANSDVGDMLAVHVNLTEASAGSLPNVNGAAHPYLRFDELGSATTTNVGLVQEWWARYDRQRLARDIYVLLYVLSGNDGTTADPTAIPTAEVNQAREMAQFAVNYVDAMDRDDVITRFEYDENLADGWDWAAGDTVVYGVEAQKLTFSEVLMVETAPQNTDDSDTMFDETYPASDTVHRFLYMELRNVSPFDVSLGQDTWRIVRVSSDGSDTMHVAARFTHENNDFTQAGNFKSIPAGENYIIGTHHGEVRNGGTGTAIGSEFYMNYDDSAANLELAIPKSTLATPIGGKANTDIHDVSTDGRVLDLDLTAINGAGTDDLFVQYTINAASGYTGTTLIESYDDASPPATASSPFHLSLQRRKNLKGLGAGEEWVEVDRFLVTPPTTNTARLDTTVNPASNGLRDEFNNKMPSQERANYWYSGLLNATQGTFPHPGSYATGVAELNHSMMAANTGNAVIDDARHQANDYIRTATVPTGVSATEIPTWQPHFDRDMVSEFDLMSVPTYGTRGYENDGAVTDAAAPAFAAANLHLVGGVTQNLVNELWYLNGHRTAQVRFLFPDETVLANATNHTWNDVNPQAYPNRWYRLLNFLEVPAREEDEAYGRLEWRRRTAGKVNANTVRHEHVYAALIDDDVHIDPITNNGAMSNTANNNVAPFTPTSDLIDTARTWFDEMRAGRDGVNVFFPGPDFVEFPGTPIAKPFKPLGAIDPAAPGASVDSTLLRRHSPQSPGLGTTSFVNTTILEARTLDDFNTGGGTGGNDEDLVDYHTRNRILAKVANLTTERSNVFVIWAGFQLHEAHEPLPGVVQIGAKADEFPLYRQLIVVDMSRLEEAYDPITGRYDYEKFIIYRQTLP